VGGGWALEIKSFLGPVKWPGADRRVPFGAPSASSPPTRPLSFSPSDSAPTLLPSPIAAKAMLVSVEGGGGWVEVYNVTLRTSTSLPPSPPPEVRKVTLRTCTPSPPHPTALLFRTI
jgi:hypothetical protein